MKARRTSRLRSMPLAVLLLLTLSPRLFAQAEASRAGILTLIEAKGSKKFSSDQIIQASGLHVGQTVRREDLQAAANRLGELGLFSNVRYRFFSLDENVKLEFQVEDAPTVPVSFDNFPWFTQDELAKAIRDAVGLYDGTAPQAGTYLDAMAEALTKLLPTRGVRGTVEHTLLARPDGDGMMQQFRVAGASLEVSAVEFSDALASHDPRVEARLSDLVGKPFSRYAAEVFAIEQVRPIYLAQGRLQVQFGEPKARFAGDPNRPLPDRVVVILPIEPGPVYHWGGATWSGNSVLNAFALDQLLGLREGQPADGMQIAAGWDRVRDAYEAQGYLDAKVEPVATYDDAAAQVSYRITIHEGTQYRMGDLVVTGLSVEAERRLREAWKIHPGQVFDEDYFNEFLKTIVKEAFGDLPVHYDEIGRWVRTNPQTKTVDVLLDFR